VLGEHIALFDELLGGVKSFAVMKKHFKSYLLGLPEAKAILARFMAVESALAARQLIEDLTSSSGSAKL
jgi:tRNA-dihydrouridine synthase